MVNKNLCRAFSPYTQTTLDVRVGSSGIRGLFATQPANKGDVLVRIPLAAALAVGSENDTAPVGKHVLQYDQHAVLSASAH